LLYCQIWPNPIGSRGIESPTPLRDVSNLAFASVGLAAALAFAVILGFAAIVTGLAAALALTAILPFAAMFGSATVVSKLSGAERRDVGAGLCRLNADSNPAKQTGHGRTGEQDFRGILGSHMFSDIFFLFIALVFLRLAMARLSILLHSKANPQAKCWRS
jgi:hypothetical protein